MADGDIRIDLIDVFASTRMAGSGIGRRQAENSDSARSAG